MVSKTRFSKVAVVSLAAGVLAVAGLGAVGTASADDGNSGGAPTAQRQRIEARQGPGGGPAQGGPMQGGPMQNRQPGGPSAPGQGAPNANRPAMQPGMRQNQAPATAEAVRAKGIIAATAEVLAVQPESVLASLEQGQTLTQVASSQGLSREFFLSALVDQIEKDIQDGQRLGIPASANLNTQIAGVIDVPSLGIRGVALSNLY
jgi:hypothetical protein